MSAYIAVYYGKSIEGARIVAVSADARLLAFVAGEMLEDQTLLLPQDPVVSALEEGRRRALRIIQQESSQ